MTESGTKRRFRWANPALVSFALTLFAGTVLSMGLPIFAFMPGPNSAQAVFAQLDRGMQAAYVALLAIIPVAIGVSGRLGDSGRARILNRCLAGLVCAITALLLFQLAGLTFRQAVPA